MLIVVVALLFPMQMVSWYYNQPLATFAGIIITFTITDVPTYNIMCENKHLHSKYLVAILMSMNWLTVYCTEKASKVGWGYYTKSGQTYLPHSIK